MGLFTRSKSDKQAEDAAGAERRRQFMNTFGNVSTDGHGQTVEESEVLDHDTHFDLHNVPAKPQTVDDKDFVKPVSLWTKEEEDERILVPRVEEHTAEELERRKKFNDFFDKVPADKTRGPVPDRTSLEHCRFENMPNQPAADPAAEKKPEDDKLVWYDYSEVKLTPKPEALDPAHQRKVETFNALYNNIEAVH